MYHLELCLCLQNVLIFFRFQNAVKSNEPSGIIIRMAQEIDFSPAILAKMLLEHYFVLRSQVIPSKL